MIGPQTAEAEAEAKEVSHGGQDRRTWIWYEHVLTEAPQGHREVIQCFNFGARLTC